MGPKTKYSREYVEKCRAQMRQQIEGFEKLEQSRNAELAAIYYSSLVLMLDSSFMHRSRAVERFDGNPLNELRMLSDSILNCNGVLTEDDMIDYDPEKSVLKLQIGEEIVLCKEQFARLAQAFFAEIEAKYCSKP